MREAKFSKFIHGFMLFALALYPLLIEPLTEVLEGDFIQMFYSGVQHT
jgi:hypothetical protein